MERFKQTTLTCLFALGLILVAQGQSKVTMGPEFQLYPTGAIPGVFMLYHLDQYAALSLRTGYNVVRHGDAGVHDDERGGGFGLSIGYQYDFGGVRAGWFGEFRSDVWFNEIDWEDRIGDVVIAAGTSDVTVVQPTLKVGYRIPMGEQRVEFIPSLAFGFEINVKTNGGAVGQGAILLLGVAAGIPIGD